MPARRSIVIVVAASVLPAALASAQPAAADERTGGLLVADTNLDAVYLVTDVDGDGVSEAATIFFGAGNASGIESATGNIFAIFQAADRTVFFGDGDSDTVYALRDNNSDGDAMDADEARVWFRGSVNFAGLPLPTPNGIAGHAGSIFILNSGVASLPQDAIYRTADLNGDGDADDENESVVWFDSFTQIAGSAAFELCFVGDAAFFADSLGGAPDSVFRLRDDDSSGIVDADEFNAFLVDGAQGAACDFSCITDGTDLFTHNLSGVQSLYRLQNLDAGNSIDSPSEVTVVWSEASLPIGSVLQSSFAIAHGPATPIRTMAISSHGTNAQDAIFLLRDLTADGDFLDTDETTALITGSSDAGVFPEDVRSMCFYAPTCRADFDRSGASGVPDIFAFLAAWFAQDPSADIDGENGIEVPDIFAFLSQWFAGC